MADMRWVWRGSPAARSGKWALPDQRDVARRRRTGCVLPRCGSRPPQAWPEDRPRCHRAGVPDDVGAQSEWQLLLGMIERARQHGFTGMGDEPREVVPQIHLARGQTAETVQPARGLARANGTPTQCRKSSSTGLQTAGGMASGCRCSRQVFPVEPAAQRVAESADQTA